MLVGKPDRVIKVCVCVCAAHTMQSDNMDNGITTSHSSRCRHASENATSHTQDACETAKVEFHVLMVVAGLSTKLLRPTMTTWRQPGAAAATTRPVEFHPIPRTCKRFPHMCAINSSVPCRLFLELNQPKRPHHRDKACCVWWFGIYKCALCVMCSAPAFHKPVCVWQTRR